MTAKDQVISELEGMPDQCLDVLIFMIRAMKNRQIDAWPTAPLTWSDIIRCVQGKDSEVMSSALLSESLLARDWLTPEEDATWANL